MNIQQIESTETKYGHSTLHCCQDTSDQSHRNHGIEMIFKNWKKKMNKNGFKAFKRNCSFISYHQL